MSWIAKLRPQVLLGLVILGAIATLAMVLEVDYGEGVVGACVVGIAQALPKLIDASEKAAGG